MRPVSRWTITEVKEIFKIAIKKLNEIKKLNITFGDAEYDYADDTIYTIKAWWIDKDDGSHYSQLFLSNIFEREIPDLGMDPEIGSKADMSLKELAILRTAYWIWSNTKNKERGA